MNTFDRVFSVMLFLAGIALLWVFASREVAFGVLLILMAHSNGAQHAEKKE